MAKRQSSSSPRATPQKRPRAGAVPWDSREDALITTLHKAGKSWAEVTEEVNALGVGPRTVATCAKRWSRTLQLEDQSIEGLTEEEEGYLKRALKEVELGSEKWWCVAARYAEITKGKEVRELKKGPAKKWSEILAKKKEKEEQKEEEA